MDLSIPKISSTDIKKPVNKGNFAVWEIIFLLIILVLGGIYFVKPKWDEYQASRTQLTIVNDQKLELDNALETIKKLNDQIKSEANKDSIALLDEGVPAEVSPSKLYILVNDLVVKSGLGVGSIDISPLSDAPDATKIANIQTPVPADRIEYTATLSVSGKIDQLIGLLKLIEDNPRLLSVKTVEVTKGEEKEKPLSFRIIAKSYSFKYQPPTK